MSAMKNLAADICASCYPSKFREQAEMMAALIIPPGDSLDLSQCASPIEAIREFYESERVWPLIEGHNLEIVADYLKREQGRAP